ncbi:putative F-box/FBD/LRR-repeat protein At4g00315 isoform X1 [Arachis stenosperma]|uniref:putative F-box/FBD/LRR-repeat protein At4g00315 isoform X1 n=1 Tax=Arachis stenosperma TaxID=217475 RepID=UPI0025AD0537|nr:putative F-box/FBD/LRR-repeat protein At4g00315 isoform X1 [Arachis stenosperma]XP_057736138.1 putative F-box/FBD/LRR-repeat protein At4g00315 isoform X1 [Arachis stenosperma]XP_057736139.1 putative F-box/FBD/LRR-repeat protein At4g00315 isoform X1 [Arachis stenosperma]XP_057736140.1 putative F-box/FBD/LRR-repeat protein At4g00315 isoform X1 [Arachis stenosperma]XP_057736141.1 putative F-box/FBD/LRR-repeat protein At4g00315 isoform X1 [Arachis stenosperma]
MDRISVLPEAILHDILARLPEKDAARTSVLSNEWRDTWYTFPILSIGDKIIIGSYSPQIISKLDILIGYVMRRLLKLREQSLTIKVFKLDMMPEHNKYMSHHFDLWMNMVSESCVEVLELCLLYSATYRGLPDGTEYRYDQYDLPLCVFEVRSLTKLVLKGKITLNQSFFNHSIKLFSLRTLCLRELLLEDKGIIEHLISYCPLLEDLTVYCCLVYNRKNPFPNKQFLESLFLHGLQKLKEADIQGIQEVYIDAPNLENLRYVPFPYFGSPIKLNLDSFTRLRCLRLSNTDVTDKWLLDLSHKFPFLEHLELCGCSMSDRINISSAQLMILEFTNYSDVKEVNIDAPNLLSFDYCGDHRAIISFLTSSDHLVFNASPAHEFRHGYYSLREFIQNIKPQKVLASLSLSVYHSNGIEQNCLSIQQVLSIPPSIKYLELDSSPNEALYFHYMNWLLSCCCPKTISFFFQNDRGMKPFTVFVYELLMGRKKQEWFDHFGDTKCWWHDLKIVKVTYSFNVDEKVDFKTTLNALLLPTDDPESVSFSLEL